MAYSKKDAIRIVVKAAEDYSNNLVNKNFLIIYRNIKTNKIDFFETAFLPRDFQHLTGLEFFDEEGKLLKKSVDFYNKCKNHQLAEKEIEFKEDGTTPFKLDALPKVMIFYKGSNMTATVDVYRPLLNVDRVAGNVTYCLGFIKDGKYYYPGSCLLEDIRNLGKKPSQILAILSKSIGKEDAVYEDVVYKAKGVNLENVVMPKTLKNLIRI